MADPTLRLRHCDMLRAIEEIDLLDVVAQELIGRVTGAAGRRGAGRLAAHHPGVAAATELTPVADPDSGRICLMPTPSLQMISLAGLAGLAARELRPPGVVTAAVFGSGTAARLHLEVIARYVPNVSHVAVYPGEVGIEQAEWNVRDRLELAGIALSISTSSRHAALGANLLVVAELGWDRLRIGHLHPGVLLINATRRDLPDELLAEVDCVYVDDIGLLEHNQHRKFARSHLAGPGPLPDPTYRYREGWYRRQQRRIDTDLGHVLTGGHRRPDVDEVILVELLGGGSLDIWLAGHIYRAAIALDLGLPFNDSEME
jgi:ornithine cyclodeaminase/alanine dehydrogenase-like protein (mu-crystallin family)